VGALLEARSIHASRSARNHLRALAATHGIPDSRVDEVMDLTGLHEVARKRAGGFSLGMAQRLGLASALLGDPSTLVLDEPVNGLDPEGIRWVRELLKGFAAEGRTVFVSSHVMSEMALTANHVVVVGRGRLIADMPIADLISSASANVVLVRSPEATRLREALAGPEVSVSSSEREVLQVSGLTQVGSVARDHNILLHELRPLQVSLEEAFMDMTRDAVEFHGTPQARSTILERSAA
jgi:ABC-2 type transport system ATP-binding protein